MDFEYKNRGDQFFAYDKGHLAASSDRSRSDKDVSSTYLMTNIIPQHLRNNQFNTAWRNLEKYSQNTLVASGGKEISIIAGGYGSLGTIPPGFIDRINVPEYTWKTILVLDNPGQSIEDVTTNTRMIAVITPNIGEPTSFPHTVNLPGNAKSITVNSLDEWQTWQTWRVSTDYLEELTGYDFWSNVPTKNQEVIEANEDTYIDPIVSSSP